MKKLITVILAIMLIFPGSVFAAARIPVYRVDGALLFFDKNTGEITGFAGDPGWLNIPAYIGGYKVNSIGEGAFANCTTLKKITFDGGISSIGAKAFYQCQNLLEAVIPGTVTSIGDSAFRECSSLGTVTFGGAIDTIAINAFDTTPWRTGGREFVIAGQTLLLKYSGTAENVVIPSGVKTIAPYAFSYNTTVKSVTIPYGVTQIGDNAFVHCYSLENIVFPSTVSSVGLGAFDDTIWLRSQKDEFVSVNGILIAYNGTGGCVSVPEGITSVADGVFMSNEKIYGVYLPAGLKSIHEAAFGGNENLSAVVVPESVEYIDDYAFTGSKNVVLFAANNSYTHYYSMINSVDFSAPIAVDVNGKGLYFDVSPVIVRGAAYVPMRAVAEALGLSISWNGAKQEASLTDGDKTVVFNTNNNFVQVDESGMEMILPPIMMGGRIMIPVRFFAELFGFDVQWDNVGRVVKING